VLREQVMWLLTTTKRCKKELVEILGPSKNLRDKKSLKTSRKREEMRS
jgi:hypothetical protein